MHTNSTVSFKFAHHQKESKAFSRFMASCLSFPFTSNYRNGFNQVDNTVKQADG
jgi:hypothetical protein